jgi:hypothetical protein
MEAKTRLAGLLWPLLDHHGDRDANDLPPEYRGQMRAMYAACEVYQVAAVASVEAPRSVGRRARVALALLRLGWIAGQLAGASRVMAARLATVRPTE